jgi:serine/threonine protein phosphatase PrpC
MTIGFEVSTAIFGQGKVCQDVFAVAEKGNDAFLILADGAGNSSSGKGAAEYFVGEIKKEVGRTCLSNDGMVNMFRGIDHSITDGETTGILVQVTDNKIVGCSVGDSKAFTCINGEFTELTEGQSRKPLLGNGVAKPKGFESCDPYDYLIVGSDGFWNYTKTDKIRSALYGVDFPVSATRLTELVRLKSGALSDDVTVIVLRHKIIRPPKRVYDLISGEYI